MASGGGTWLADMAREELQMLEAQHPDRFGYLKLELKSFISHPNACSDLFFCGNHDDHDRCAPDPPADHDVATQVSSNRKRKVIEWNDELQQHQNNSSKRLSVAGGDGKRGGGCRVDMAMKKAEACLKRIQLVKQSFFC